MAKGSPASRTAGVVRRGAGTAQTATARPGGSTSGRCTRDGFTQPPPAERPSQPPPALPGGSSGLSPVTQQQRHCSRRCPWWCKSQAGSWLDPPRGFAFSLLERHSLQQSVRPALLRAPSSSPPCPPHTPTPRPDKTTGALWLLQSHSRSLWGLCQAHASPWQLSGSVRHHTFQRPLWP